MTIPIHTTTISVLRVPTTPMTDPYDVQAAADVVASGVRAHISLSQAISDETVRGGSQEVVQWRMSCDPVDLVHTDQVRDDRTGDLYDVVWARQRVGLNLDHTQAELKQVTGVV